MNELGTKASACGEIISNVCHDRAEWENLLIRFMYIICCN